MFFKELTIFAIESITVVIDASYSNSFIENLSKLFINAAKNYKSPKLKLHLSRAFPYILASIAQERFCGNITELNLNCPCYLGQLDDELTVIFKENKYLKKFRISSSHTDTFRGECLMFLNPVSIKDVAIDCNYSSIEGFLIQFLNSVKNLRSLDCDLVNEDIVGSFANCLSGLHESLESLSLRLHVPINQEINYSISCLKNLKFLGIQGMHNDFVEYGFFTQICKNLKKLNCLVISEFNGVCELGIEFLRDLPNIEELRFICVATLDGYGIQQLSNLKVFVCVGCYNFDENMLIQLLKHDTCLSYLEFRGSHEASIELVRSAIKETKKRTNMITLDLSIDVDLDGIMSEIQDVSPRLRLRTRK